MNSTPGASAPAHCSTPPLIDAATVIAFGWPALRRARNGSLDVGRKRIARLRSSSSTIAPSRAKRVAMLSTRSRSRPGAVKVLDRDFLNGLDPDHREADLVRIAVVGFDEIADDLLQRRREAFADQRRLALAATLAEGIEIVVGFTFAAGVVDQAHELQCPQRGFPIAALDGRRSVRVAVVLGIAAFPIRRAALRPAQPPCARQRCGPGWRIGECPARASARLRSRMSAWFFPFPMPAQPAMCCSRMTRARRSAQPRFSSSAIACSSLSAPSSYCLSTSSKLYGSARSPRFQMHVKRTPSESG
jgi:hypothetical protein